MRYPAFNRAIFQNAWIVDDLEAACQTWTQQLGVGPFFINQYELETFDRVTYYGAPSDISMRIAISQAGPLQIELIQPLSERNAYRDIVPEGQGQTFHHVCSWTDDFEAELKYFESAGYPIINTGQSHSVSFAYIDTRPILGSLLEIVTKTPAIQARFDFIAQAASSWQGDEPLRYS